MDFGENNIDFYFANRDKEGFLDDAEDYVTDRNRFYEMGEAEGWAYMTDEEYRTYVYIREKSGVDEAHKYLDALYDNELEWRKFEYNAEELSDLPPAGKILYALTSGAVKSPANVLRFADMLDGADDCGFGDSEKMFQAVAQRSDEGERWFLDVAHSVGSLATQSALSDGTGVLGFVSKALPYADIFMNSFSDAVETGYGGMKAFGKAATDAATEGIISRFVGYIGSEASKMLSAGTFDGELSEYLAGIIGNGFSTPKNKALAYTLTRLFNSGVGEGTEEIVSYTVECLSDFFETGEFKFDANEALERGLKSAVASITVGSAQAKGAYEEISGYYGRNKNGSSSEIQIKGRKAAEIFGACETLEKFLKSVGLSSEEAGNVSGEIFVKVIGMLLYGETEEAPDNSTVTNAQAEVEAKPDDDTVTNAKADSKRIRLADEDGTPNIDASAKKLLLEMVDKIRVGMGYEPWGKSDNGADVETEVLSSETKHGDDTETNAQAEAEVKSDNSTEMNAQTEDEAKPDNGTETNAQTEDKAKPDNSTETNAQTEDEAKPDNSTEMNAQAEAAAKSDNSTETNAPTETEADSKRIRLVNEDGTLNIDASAKKLLLEMVDKIRVGMGYEPKWESVYGTDGEGETSSKEGETKHGDDTETNAQAEVEAKPDNSTVTNAQTEAEAKPDDSTVTNAKAETEAESKVQIRLANEDGTPNIDADKAKLLLKTADKIRVGMGYEPKWESVYGTDGEGETSSKEGEAKPDNSTEMNAQTEAEAKPDDGAEMNVPAEAEAKPDNSTETKAQTEAEAKPGDDTEMNASAESKTDSNSKRRSDTDIENEEKYESEKNKLKEYIRDIAEKGVDFSSAVYDNIYGKIFTAEEIEALKDHNIKPYGRLKALFKGQQKNHLIPVAIAKGFLSRNRGLSYLLEGDVIKDKGSSHRKYHQSIEKALDVYREKGTAPTWAETAMIVFDALVDIGVDASTAKLAASASFKQIAATGVDINSHIRMPRKMYFLKN